MMPEPLFEIACTPDCGFQVRSHERNETVDLAMHHAHMAHPEMDANAQMMRDQVHEVAAPSRPAP